jgi:hypothetical protein
MGAREKRPVRNWNHCRGVKNVHSPHATTSQTKKNPQARTRNLHLIQWVLSTGDEQTREGEIGRRFLDKHCVQSNN